jgi:hypothetical protein
MKRSYLRCTLLLFVFILLSQPSAMAANSTVYKALEEVVTNDSEPKIIPQWIVVLDLTEKKAFSFDADTPFVADPTPPSTPREELHEAVTGSSTPRMVSASAVLKQIGKMANDSTDRWVSAEGNSVKIYIFHPKGPQVKLSIAEKDRDTQFATDLQTLLKLATTIIKQVWAAPATPPEPEVSAYAYTLTKVRSSLSITASLAEKAQLAIVKADKKREDSKASRSSTTASEGQEQPEGQAEPAEKDPLAIDFQATIQASADQAQAQEQSSVAAPVVKAKDQPAAVDKDERQVKTVIITGPREHWFLSADLGINKVTQLKYDSTSKSLENKDKPSKFLVGVNYALGDILTHRWTAGDWWQGITLKLLLVEASSQPLDSLAFGLGYRLPPIKILGLSLDNFSPFIAYSRVLNDQALPNGAVNEGGSHEWKWIFGISFNLDKALDWVQKASAK